MIRVGAAGRHPQPVDVPAPERPPLWGRNAITDHPFERWESSNGWVACIHLDSTRPCGRPEDEHAPAPGRDGAEA